MMIVLIEDIAVTSSQVTIINNEVAINPTTDLHGIKKFYVQVPLNTF